MDIKYEVKQDMGVLSERNGWSRCVKLISWNERDPKIDIRDWSTDGSKMSKGIGLSMEEARELKNILNKIDFDELD